MNSGVFHISGMPFYFLSCSLFLVVGFSSIHYTAIPFFIVMVLQIRSQESLTITVLDFNVSPIERLNCDCISECDQSQYPFM